MKLRHRILASLGFTAASLIAAMAWLSMHVMGASYADLERRDTARNVLRGKDAIRERLVTLHAKCLDWAAWDDTYAFMRDRNRSYIESNLTVLNQNLDAILYLDVRGRLHYARTVERTKGVTPPDPKELVRKIGFDLPLARRPGGGRAISGYVDLAGRPTMVSIWPVVKSTHEGPPRGWIVFVQYLDAGELRQLSEQIHLPLEVRGVREAGFAPDRRTALARLRRGEATVVRPLDEDVVAGYALLSDLHGRAFGLLRIEEPRAIHAQGRRTTLFLVGGLAVVAMAFLLVTVLSLERIVLSRLSRLTGQVVEIQNPAAARTRTELRGRDELASLGTEINAMVGQLESGARELGKSQAALKAHNESLERTVRERTVEIAHQALHDKLTGLPNRALSMDRIARALAGSRPGAGAAALFVDLDNFKLVNDSLGHAMGDQLLIRVAEILSSSVRHGDTVARIGGDEFTILLENRANVGEAVEVAERVLAQLRRPIELAGRETFACASLGIAFSDDPRMTGPDLLKNADGAMYRAKDSGKSTYVVFDESMHEHAIDRLELETDLRQAIERDELSAHYQPLIDLQTGRLLGCEALARWSHPTRGSVSPGRFIPIAEATGLIIPIGYWILEVAARRAQEWIERFGLTEFTLSVNLSGKQLQREDVVERVQEVLSRTGLSPAHLKLEITESVLMEDQETVVRKMAGLKALGVRLALDDFGTGYSSLSILWAFPIDTLKIDRAFIRRLAEDDDALEIVRAILGLARTMGIDTTSEGVETEAQARILRELGCDVGQGYLYDRPLPGGEFAERLGTASRGLASRRAA